MNLRARMHGREFLENLFERQPGHGLVSLVMQPRNRRAVFHFPHDPLKFHLRANFPQPIRRGGRNDGRVNEFNVRFHGQPPLTGGISASSTAAPTG